MTVNKNSVIAGKKASVKLEDGLQSKECASNVDRNAEERRRSILSGLTCVTYKYQALVVTMAYIGVSAGGAIMSFPSVIITDLEENNSTIFGTSMTLTETEKDLMGSLANFGGIAGVIFGGVATGAVGRLPVLRTAVVCFLVSWIGVALSVNSSMCLFFRFVGGMGYSITGMVGMSYLVEIADSGNRGVISIGHSASQMMGQIVGVLPTHWLRYYVICFLNCIFPSIFLLCALTYLPETPRYLTVKGRESEAADILLKLRGDPDEVKKEMNVYKEKNETFMSVNFWQTISEKSVYKKLIIVWTLFLIQVFAGYTVFVSQTARVLSDTGSTINQVLSTNLIQCSQLVGSFVIASQVQRLGRRGSLIVSGLVTGAAVMTLATFTLFYERTIDIRGLNITDTYSSTEAYSMLMNGDFDAVEEYEFVRQNGWVPLVCLMVAQIGLGIGLRSVPFILSSEYFPTAIRHQITTMCYTLFMCASFINLQFYTPLKDALSMAGLLYFYASVAFSAVPFTYVFVKETIGKPVG